MTEGKKGKVFVLTSLMKELHTAKYIYLTIKNLSFLNEMSRTLDIRCLNQRQFHSILDDLRLLDCPAPQGTIGEFIEARRFLNIKWKL